MITDKMMEAARLAVRDRTPPPAGSPPHEGATRAAIEAVAPLIRAAALEEAAGMSPAAKDVLAERERQISAEGWTAEHDDSHIDRELARAAACYALHAAASIHLFDRPVQTLWPWFRKYWKPTDKRRSCVKAAALLIAEIERLDRRTLKEKQP